MMIYEMNVDSCFICFPCFVVFWEHSAQTYYMNISLKVHAVLNDAADYTMQTFTA